MTTMTMETMTMETPASLRGLEELVDRLLAALLGDGADADNAPNSGLVCSVHVARRLRQASCPPTIGLATPPRTVWPMLVERSMRCRPPRHRHF